jgi:hypothetical protein
LTTMILPRVEFCQITFDELRTGHRVIHLLYEAAPH